jgi:hypothetical protein
MSQVDEISYSLTTDSNVPILPHRTGKDYQAQQQRLNLQVCVAAGTIDIIQNFPHYRETDEQQISYPMGLMILKWIPGHVCGAGIGNTGKKLNANLLKLSKV